MAKMFPQVFPRDSNSSGERKVFEHFKMHAPDDWYILHSFRIPKHKRVVFGEADFVVVAPDLGVFVLEVKSGGVGFDGTNWSFTNREGNTNYKQRGPFQQAREAMFEIENILFDKLGEMFDARHIHYSYGVIFTDEDSFPANKMTEDESWRLLQRKDINDYCGFIKYLYRQFEKELISLGKKLPKKLSAADANTIALTLRPIVECTVPLKSFLYQSEEDIINFTEEQLECLDDIYDNSRVVVSGGAGTGKTLLAIEDAKRTAETGKRVCFLCYNKNLASYIRLNIDKDNIDVYSVDSFFVHYCKNVLKNEFIDVGSNDKNEYYRELLPEQMLMALSIQDKKYDKLIVDEFQDLCVDTYLKIFDKILKNGLIDGNFTFYGDFALQAIYLNEPDLSLLNNYAYYTNKKLKKNCSNTKNIGEELIKITGYPQDSYRLQIIGEPVEFIPYSDRQEERDKLIGALRQLKEKGIKNNEIVILSPNIRIKSVVNDIDPNKYLICDYGENLIENMISFSTIHSYKGLESKIVVLVDIEDYSKTNLLYVGISRARSKLIVFESKDASKQRKKMV